MEEEEKRRQSSAEFSKKTENTKIKFRKENK
jgi:hypothetical protein